MVKLLKKILNLFKKCRMAKINNITSYPISTPVTGSDIVIGSITGSGGDTANFLMSGIANYMTGQISLANVCSVGSTTATTMDIADTLTLSKASGTGLAVTANATIGGRLTITGTGLGNGLVVSGDGSVGGTFGVVGITTLTGALDANSTADIADTLTLSKPTGYGLQVTANAIINGDHDVYGDASVLGIFKATKPTGTGLQVDADANIDGSLTANKPTGTGLTVAADAIIDGVLYASAPTGTGLKVDADAGISGNLDVTGAIDANSTADIADTLTLSKATGTGLQVTANAIIDGSLDVTGVTTLTGALDANSTADIADTLTLSKATGTGLQVDSNAEIDGSLTVNSTASFTDAGSSISAAGLISTSGNILALGTIGAAFLLTDPAGAPLSASATGTTGSIVADANYIYVCTATDTWKRVAIATW
jgi:hypothetical protein